MFLVISQEDDEPDDFMERPEGIVSLIIWALCLPVYIPLYYTLLGSQYNAVICRVCMAIVWACARFDIETCWGLGPARDRSCIWSPLVFLCFGSEVLPSFWSGGLKLHPSCFYGLALWRGSASKARTKMSQFSSVVQPSMAQVASIIGAPPSEAVVEVVAVKGCYYVFSDFKTSRLQRHCEETWTKLEHGFKVNWAYVISYVPLITLKLTSFCLKVPTIISGLTFLAAATSIPDAVSSMAVARKGPQAFRIPELSKSEVKKSLHH